MKVLVLDHDGVMCLSTEWGGRMKKIKKWKLKNPDSEGYVNDPKIPSHIRMDNFNSKAVKVLNEILEITDAEIVVSSDWKLHCTLFELQSMFKEYGVIKSPIDITPNKVLTNISDLEDNRVLEINTWLNDHPEVSHWVAVDDLDLSELPNFVQTKKPYNEGIKQSGIKDKIIGFLS
jgi:hypothetical protein